MGAATTRTRIVHVIEPFRGDSPLAQRQELFLESIDRARKDGVVLLAAGEGWARRGWLVAPLSRDARILGDESDKAFLKDLLDLALEHARPGDWLLYSNVDCSFAPDLYEDLVRRGGCVVEYMRQDVEGNPRTLEALFSNPRQPLTNGIDALALRATLYREIRDELPDLIVGEPHWDTTLSGMLRGHVPVQRDTVRLFHPRHAQVWSLADPTPAGRHNQRLFEESLACGYVRRFIEEEPDRTDTAVIMACFGDGEERIEAHLRGLRGQLEQDLYVDRYLMEIGDPRHASPYSDILAGRGYHLRLPGSRSSGDLFQKEALFNLAWQTAVAHHSYDYLIFVDADVHSEDPTWFRQIRERLREDPARAVHGFRTVRDTRDRDGQFQSLGAAHTLGEKMNLLVNPGTCWGVHRRMLEMGHGFNPFCIDGAGDSAFVTEYLNLPGDLYDPWLYQYRWFREIRRRSPYRARLDWVPMDLVHEYHGPLRERNYTLVRLAIENVRPVRELVRMNDGILEWIDPDCGERRLLRQRALFTSESDVEAALRDIGFRLDHFPEPQLLVDVEDRPVLPEDGVPLPRIFGKHRKRADRGAPSGGVPLFDPWDVFHEDYLFSWCSGVRTIGGSERIPLEWHGEFPALVLDGLPGAPWGVGAVPLRVTWMPMDVSGFRILSFMARVTSLNDDVVVHMVTLDEAGTERESRPVSLRTRGLVEGQWQRFEIPLDAFGGAGFDLRRTRMAKFVAYGCCSLKLGRIYIE